LEQNHHRILASKLDLNHIEDDTSGIIY